MNSSVAGVAQATLLFGPERRPICFAYSIAIAAAIFLVGPGGYAVDSLLFGRRLIRSNSR
jgi:hypothetical protein